MWIRIPAALLLAMAVMLPVRATSLRPASLDDIVGASRIAFEATCVSNRTEREAKTGLVVTYTTFEVHDVLKGQAETTHVIKQIGGQMHDGSLSYRVYGVPTFTPGQDYVVFLAGVSSAGFSSPIALSQGRFDVRVDEKGGKKVGNGRDFGELTADVPAAQMPAGLTQKLRQSNRVTEMDLDAFKALVRARASSSPAPLEMRR